MIEIGTSPTVESRQSTTDQLSQVDKLRASLHQVPRGGARPDRKPHAPPLFLKRPIFDKSGRFRVYVIRRRFDGIARSDFRENAALYSTTRAPAPGESRCWIENQVCA